MSQVRLDGRDLVANVTMDAAQLGAAVAALQPAHLIEFLVGFANGLAKVHPSRLSMVLERATTSHSVITTRGQQILAGLGDALNKPNL